MKNLKLLEKFKPLSKYEQSKISGGSDYLTLPTFGCVVLDAAAATAYAAGNEALADANWTSAYEGGCYIKVD